jgi:hypothetical protein
MTDVRSAWKDAGERLSAFGSTLKAQYEEHATESSQPAAEAADDVDPGVPGDSATDAPVDTTIETTTEAAPDAATDSGTASAAGNDADADRVGEAVKKLTGAVQETFDAVGATARSPQVREDAKKVGQSLIGALSLTFAEVTDDLRKAADKARNITPPR